MAGGTEEGGRLMSGTPSEGNILANYHAGVIERLQHRIAALEQKLAARDAEIARLRAALEAIIARELAGWGKKQPDRDCIAMSDIARTALAASPGQGRGDRAP